MAKEEITHELDLLPLDQFTQANSPEDMIRLRQTNGGLALYTSIMHGLRNETSEAEDEPER